MLLKWNSQVLIDFFFSFYWIFNGSISSVLFFFCVWKILDISRYVAMIFPPTVSASVPIFSFGKGVARPPVSKGLTANEQGRRCLWLLSDLFASSLLLWSTGVRERDPWENELCILKRVEIKLLKVKIDRKYVESNSWCSFERNDLIEILQIKTHY